jgi:hypothetical protein
MADLKLLIKLFNNYGNKLKDSIKNKDDINILYYKNKYNESLKEMDKQLKALDNADQFEFKLLDKLSKKRTKKAIIEVVQMN